MAPLEPLDTLFLVVLGIFVFFMQAGFAMLEAGAVRAKNTKNILLKNVLDACIGAFVWWAWGYGLAYGSGPHPNPFIGTADVSSETQGGQGFLSIAWTGNQEHPVGYDFASWFFSYGFAAAASTIVSGAVAERTQLSAYLVYTVFITGWIYPLIAHWVWAPAGWLSAYNPDKDDAVLGGCIDFAGSSVVHLTGGIAGLVGSAIIGARRGRYGPDGDVVEMPGHSTVLQVLGTFILWAGWYGFNPGSTLAISTDDDAQTMARVVMTTTLSAAAAGTTTVIIDRLIGSRMWDVPMMCNGVLIGLVSITAGCAVVSPWYAYIIGILGGGIFFGASKLVKHKLRVDDPLDAFAVHGMGGLWGMLATGFFGDPDYTRVYYAWVEKGSQADDKYSGSFFGGTHVLGAAVVAVITIIAWTAFWASIVFGVLKVSGVLRVSNDVEDAGMDVSKHGGAMYVDAAVPANSKFAPRTFSE